MVYSIPWYGGGNICYVINDVNSCKDKKKLKHDNFFCFLKTKIRRKKLPCKVEEEYKQLLLNPAIFCMKF